MSIIPIDTKFRNISVGPYVIDEFWVNEQGFSATVVGSTLAIPGLYGQGTTILSCSLISPGAGLNSYLSGGSTFGVKAVSNVAGGAGTRILYQSLGTALNVPGTGLGATLPADSWLQLDVGAATLAATGQSIGLVVKYTNLTQTQPRYGVIA